VQLSIAIVTRSGTSYVLVRIAAFVGAVAAALFLFRPDLDLEIARLFVMADGHFVGQRGNVVPVLRETFKAIYVIACVVALAGLVAAARRPTGRSSILRLVSIYLVLCLSAGPGLVANLLLKDQSGRARPSQTTEFGGSKQFTPAFVPARECDRNCSFVSGEASSMFVIFYGVALIIPQWSSILIAAGTVAGIAAGMVRMAQGAHFLSDVIFAGVFMALTVACVHWAVFTRAMPRSLNLTLTAVSR
jgi:lipid A 4'-phosphatase